MEGLWNTEIDDIFLHGYFSEQYDIPPPWNLYLTQAAPYGGGLEIDNPVFGDSCTKYRGANSWFKCDIQAPRVSEGQYCTCTYETEGQAPAVAAKALPPPLSW